MRARVWRPREKERRRLSRCQVPGKELSRVPGKDPESTGSRWGAEGPSGATHLLPTLPGSRETDRRLAARRLPLTVMGFSQGCVLETCSWPQKYWPLRIVRVGDEGGASPGAPSWACGPGEGASSLAVWHCQCPDLGLAEVEGTHLPTCRVACPYSQGSMEAWLHTGYPGNADRDPAPDSLHLQMQPANPWKLRSQTAGCS